MSFHVIDNYMLYFSKISYRRVSRDDAVVSVALKHAGDSGFESRWRKKKYKLINIIQNKFSVGYAHGESDRLLAVLQPSQHLVYCWLLLFHQSITQSLQFY